ncbi:MAG TPA: response regulator [Puia sp.]|nr:response regulator [Puia sp.]
MENNIFSKNYPLNILIAEHHHDARSSAKDLLLRLGYQPVVVTTSQEMLKLTRKKRFDVVLMDVQMPEMDGVLASRTGETGTRKPIFIAMTISDPDGIGEIYLRPGMDHSIAKPVDPDELTLQLKACSVLAGTRRIRTGE